MSFAKDLQRFSQKVESNAEDLLEGVALSLSRSVIERTPVDTGRLRGNWQSSINTPASGETDSLDKSGGAAITAAASIASQFKLGSSFFLVNNLPYAKTIEEGSSQQAPQGMVKITVSEFHRKVNEQAKKLSNK